MDDDRRPGRLEVVAGPMFAGKTEELVRRVHRAEIARRHVLVVSHRLDVRSGSDTVASHSGLSLPSVAVQRADEIPALVEDGTDLVAIDEAQFFGAPLLDVAVALADSGLVVVVAGLSVTFDGRPFVPLPELMAVAEQVTKLTAVCSTCGRDAAFHVRLQSADAADVGAGPHADPLATVPGHVGGSESYEARCRLHQSSTSGTNV